MKILCLVLSMIALFFGAIFKIQHWPNADILPIACLGLFPVFHLMVILQLLRQQQFRFGTRIPWLALASARPTRAVYFSCCSKRDVLQPKNLRPERHKIPGMHLFCSTMMYYLTLSGLILLVSFIIFYLLPDKKR
ncbi:hypothetical protein [Chitinophaga rhizosphaerae]|uniref:hypothetical protein n=1 Tax=Chitinophaga rhizosphaerae TaxID=1864947 RepID=UPI000F80F51B|nr:hypothetical protein [Chitinophaga rhizosphaerae]